MQWTRGFGTFGAERSNRYLCPKEQDTAPAEIDPVILVYCMYGENRREFPLTPKLESEMVENVYEMPLTPRMAERLLREAVEDSSKLVNTIAYGPDEAWYELTSNRQVMLCLKEGRVVREPVKDEHGNWNAVSYRLCGGSDVYVTTAIEMNDDRSIKTVYVLNVDNRYML